MLRPDARPLPLLLLLATFTPLLTPSPTAAQTDTPDAIDRFWAEASRTVAEGDFEGYAALYHEDAVLVNGMADSTYPIADALAGWRQGFEDTRAGRMGARVDFRFTRRLHGETTAHETGIFRYVAHPRGGEPSVSLVHFQALMVRKEGEWKWVMEYQVAPATEEEWEAAGG